MSAELVTIICLLAALVVALFQNAAATDQARELRKERDKAEARADRWEAAQAATERTMYRWMNRALDAELGLGLMGNELERVEAAHVDELTKRRSARKVRSS